MSNDADAELSSSKDRRRELDEEKQALVRLLQGKEEKNRADRMMVSKQQEEIRKLKEELSIEGGPRLEKEASDFHEIARLKELVRQNEQGLAAARRLTSERDAAAIIAEQERDAARSTAADLDKRLSALASAAHEKSADALEAQKRCAKAEQGASRAASELSVVTREVGELRDEMSNLKGQYNSLKLKHAEVSSNSESYSGQAEGRITKAEESERFFRAEADGIRNELSSVARAKTQADNDNSRLRAMTSDLEGKLAELTRTAGTTIGEVTDLKRLIDEKSGASAAADRARRDMQSKYLEAEQRMDSLVEERDRARKELDAHRADVQRARDEGDQKEEDAKSSASEQQQKLLADKGATEQSLRKEIAALKHQVSSLSVKLQDAERIAEEELQKLRSDKASLSARSKLVEDEATAAKAKLTGTEQLLSRKLLEADEMRKANEEEETHARADLEDALAKARNEARGMHDSVASAKREAQDATQQAAEMAERETQALNRAKSMSDALTATRKSLKTEREQLASTQGELTESSAALDKARRHAQKYANEAGASGGEVEIAKMKMKKEKSMMTDRLNTAESKARDLQSKVKSLEAVATAAKESNDGDGGGNGSGDGASAADLASAVLRAETAEHEIADLARQLEIEKAVLLEKEEALELELARAAKRAELEDKQAQAQGDQASRSAQQLAARERALKDEAADALARAEQGETRVFELEATLGAERATVERERAARKSAEADAAKEKAAGSGAADNLAEAHKKTASAVADAKSWEDSAKAASSTLESVREELNMKVVMNQKLERHSVESRAAADAEREGALSLRAEVQRLRAEVIAAQEAEDAAAAKALAVDKQLSEYTSGASDVTKEAEQLRAQCKALGAARTAAEAETAALESQLAESNGAVKAANASKATAVALRSTLEDSSAAATQKISELEREVAHLSGGTEGLRAEMQQREQRAERLSAEVDELRAQKAEIEAQLSASSSAQTALREEIANGQSRVAAGDDTLATVTRQTAELLERLQAAEEQLGAKDLELKQQRQATDTAVAAGRAEGEALSAALVDAESRASDSDVALAELTDRSQRSAVQGAEQAKAEALASQEALLREKMETAVTVADGRVGEAENKVSILSAELQTALQSSARLQAQILELQKQLEQAASSSKQDSEQANFLGQQSERITQLQAQVDSLSKALAEKDGAMALRESELKGSGATDRANAERATAQLQQLQAELKEAQDALSDARLRQTELELGLAQAQKQAAEGGGGSDKERAHAQSALAGANKQLASARRELALRAEAETLFVKLLSEYRKIRYKDDPDAEEQRVAPTVAEATEYAQVRTMLMLMLMLILMMLLLPLPLLVWLPLTSLPCSTWASSSASSRRCSGSRRRPSTRRCRQSTRRTSISRRTSSSSTCSARRAATSTRSTPATGSSTRCSRSTAGRWRSLLDPTAAASSLAAASTNKFEWKYSLQEHSTGELIMTRHRGAASRVWGYCGPWRCTLG